MNEVTLDFSGHMKAVVRSSDHSITERIRLVFSAGALPAPTQPVPEHLMVYEVEPPGAESDRFTVWVNGNDAYATPSAETLLWYLEGAIVDRLIRQLGGYRLFHAGAVRYRGKGILLPGESGSGKSTTVAALVMSGAVFYSDEIAVIGKDLSARPFPRVMGLKPGGWRALCKWFPEQAFELTVNRAEDAQVHYVRPLAVPGPVSEPLRIDCIVLPERDPSGVAALTPVPPTTAIATLVTQSLDLKIKGKPAFDALVALAQQARCYSLTVPDMGSVMSAMQGIT